MVENEKSFRELFEMLDKEPTDDDAKESLENKPVFDTLCEQINDLYNKVEDLSAENYKLKKKLKSHDHKNGRILFGDW